MNIDHPATVGTYCLTYLNTNVYRSAQSVSLCTIFHSIGTECVRCAWLRSVLDRVRLNVTFSACIK